MDSKMYGRTWPLFEVLGEVLGYFRLILIDFWDSFPLFHAILHYITLRYVTIFHIILP